MKKTLSLLISLATLFSVSAQSKEFTKCSVAQQSRLVEAEALALQAGDDLSIEVKSALADPGRPGKRPKNDRKLQYAASVLKCAVKRLPQLNYVCEKKANGDLLAMTMLMVGRKTRVYPSLFSRLPRRMASTLLHEATHKCGAIDSVDFSKSSPPRSAGLVGWAMNADTYGYWVKSGFCIPGETCN